MIVHTHSAIMQHNAAKDLEMKYLEVKDKFVLYQAYNQSASTSGNNVWYFYNSKDEALGDVLDKFSDEINESREEDLREFDSVDLTDYRLSIIQVSDITQDDNYCSFTDQASLDGDVIIEIANPNSNTSRRQLVISQFVYEDD